MSNFLPPGLPSRPFKIDPYPYKLFISHAWNYTGDYDRLLKLLNSDLSFRWENLSVPEKRPLPFLWHLAKSYRFLVRQIDERISQADCLLVIAGMYVAHRGWIQSEIEAAQAFSKPIIAIEPWGSEKFPDALLQTATERVKWNTSSIVAAIRKRVVITPNLPRLTIPKPNF